MTDDWTDRLLATDDEDRDLRRLGGMPRALLRLDEQVRHVLWDGGPRAQAVARAVEPVRAGEPAGRVAVVLASMHRDGRLREQAVARMVAYPHPIAMPFLMLRAADWVGPVRDRAQVAVALLLGRDPAAYLPAALPVGLAGKDRGRGRFGHAQVLAALITAPPAVRDALLTTAARQFVLDVGLTHGWWPAGTVLATAKSSDTVRVRARAAEAVARDALWAGRPAVLRRMVRHARPEVREAALTGLVRLGLDTEVAEHLDDPAPLIRATARAAARRAGIDAGEHYRQAVDGPEPPLGAIAGLAETGTGADLLGGLLTHPAARVRAQAVRGLRLLDAVTAGPVAPLLRDPSPAVIRAAADALRSLTLPDDLVHGLLADPRPEVRRAGYHLSHRRGLEELLRAGLTLATDPEPRLAARAVADVTRLARVGAGRPWHSRTVPPPWPDHHAGRDRPDGPGARPGGSAADVTPETFADLVAHAAPALGPETTAMLRARLDLNAVGPTRAEPR